MSPYWMPFDVIVTPLYVVSGSSRAEPKEEPAYSKPSIKTRDITAAAALLEQFMDIKVQMQV